MLGSKIKAAREAKRFSQEYMAVMLNITQASYSRLESNITKTDVIKLRIIAEVLNIDILILINAGADNFKKVR